MEAAIFKTDVNGNMTAEKHTFQLDAQEVENQVVNLYLGSQQGTDL